MPSMDIRDIDHSDAMRDYFESVRTLLMKTHGFSGEAAQAAVNQYFSIDVAAMERVFAMHTDAEHLAADLAGVSLP